MSQWSELADEPAIERTITGLKLNGIEAVAVADGAEAKQRALSLIPAGSEVMTMTSMTLQAVGLTDELNESGRFISTRKKLMALDRKTQGQEMNRLGAASAFTVGSVHAVTQDGHVLIASKTGSQLPAYASASPRVIWVVGAQKIVANDDEGRKRIYEHCLPLEDQRARAAYGIASAVNKILLITNEIIPGRVTMILVREKLGF